MRVQGMTIEQIAPQLGIHWRTFYKWVDRYAEVRAALVESTGTLLDKVADSLFKRAMGFSYEETKVYGHLADDGRTFVTDRIERTQKYALPDAGAAMSVLTNKDPDKWKLRQETTHVLEDRRAVIFDLRDNVALVGEDGEAVRLPEGDAGGKDDRPIHSDDGGDGRR